MSQAVDMRVALFRALLPEDFVRKWLPGYGDPNPKTFGVPISQDRSFGCAFLVAKIEDMIGSEGDPMGDSVVGPLAFACKVSLLELIPLIMPPDDDATPGFYRLVLEHGDFGIHNMTIIKDVERPEITSLFDWDMGHIVPAFLSDPKFWIGVNLTIGPDGNGTCDIWEEATPEDRANYVHWASCFGEVRGLQSRL